MSDAITLKGELLFPSEYIGAVDLKGRDVTVEIEHVELADLQMQGGKKSTKPLIYFKGAKKKLVMNKTNARTIASLYGGAVESWSGKKITIYPTKTRCGGSTVDCVRVREEVPGKPRPDPVPSFDDLPGDASTADAEASYVGGNDGV